jgi:hypothetical protein
MATATENGLVRVTDLVAMERIKRFELPGGRFVSGIHRRNPCRRHSEWHERSGLTC